MSNSSIVNSNAFMKELMKTGYQLLFELMPMTVEEHYEYLTMAKDALSELIVEHASQNGLLSIIDLGDYPNGETETGKSDAAEIPDVDASGDTAGN